MKCLHENGCPWGYETSSSAAENGQFDWSSRTCSKAALGGHLECLKYAHENGCPWDEKTCYVAALSGHLECLKYLHEKGCPWNEKTSSYYDKGRDLEYE